MVQSSVQHDIFGGTIGAKRCVTCKEDAGPFRKNAQSPDGLSYYCAPCERKYSERYREDRKERSWLRHYGISGHAYWDMFEQQCGVCAICKQPESKIHRGTPAHLSVDHDHKTGNIRGLLCSNCNSGIGHFRDDIDLLKSAIGYLSN